MKINEGIMVTASLHSKKPSPQTEDDFVHYIFSGALTPINFSAFANVVFTAVINAKRASVNSLFSGLNTFSAL